MTTPAIRLGDGYIVAVEFSAHGGVRWEREALRSEETHEGRGLLAEFKTTKRVDDVELVKESTQIVTRAYYLVEKHCAKTPIGYYIDAAALPELERAIVEVRDAADIFNRVARQAGSKRRVTAEIYPLPLDMDDERCARRLARLVLERLGALQAALRAGDRKAFESEWERCHNLERLATGIQREAIEQAMETAKEKKAEMLMRLRAGAGPELAGQALDLEPMEATARLFC